MGESNNRSGSRFYTFLFCVLYVMLRENDTPGHVWWFCIRYATK